MLADITPKAEILPVSTSNLVKSTVLPPSHTTPIVHIVHPYKTPEPVPPPVKFGWAQVEVINPAIPYIKRDSLCLVAEQIYLPKINEELKTYFTAKFFECLSHKTYVMTEEEALVFNDINLNHCDRQLVGNHVFTQGMLMIELQELKLIVQFLKACFEAFFMKKYENTLFGFVRIGGESDVPFVWYNQKQMVPLFYFDGEIEYLDERSIELTEQWPLDFLKFCCLIHNIRKEHYQSLFIKVVDIELVKSLSDEGTSFKVEWPKKVNPELLVDQDQTRPKNYIDSRTSFLKLAYFVQVRSVNSPVPNPYQGIQNNVGQNNPAYRQLAPIENRMQAPISTKKREKKTVVGQPKVNSVNSKASQKTINNGKKSYPDSTVQRSTMCADKSLNMVNPQRGPHKHSQQKSNLAPYIRHVTNVPHQSPQPASCPTSEASTPSQPQNTQPVTGLNQQIRNAPPANAYQETQLHKPVQLSLYQQHLMEDYFMSQMFVLDPSQDTIQAWQMTINFMRQFHIKSSSELSRLIHMRFCEMITTYFKSYRRENSAPVNISHNSNVATMAPLAAQTNNRNGIYGPNRLLNGNFVPNNLMGPQNLSGSMTAFRTGK